MIGAITVPAVAAQGICDRLVAAGVTSILNFAPVVLNVPEGVDVRKVDLSIELQILAFHAQRRAAGASGPVKAPVGHENGSIEVLRAPVINGTPLDLSAFAAEIDDSGTVRP
jgi:hypothetical protein